MRTGHELRNPLHGVCAGVKALQDGTLTPAEAVEEMKAIAEGLALMVNITNDMTDLQKLRSGQFTMHLAPTSLRHVLESCVLSVRPSLQRATDIELLCDGDVPDAVSVTCVYIFPQYFIFVIGFLFVFECAAARVATLAADVVVCVP